ncbi:hypothetical protein [Planktotalea sp.]|uniref:hypothetical protein n=1 Tax=Planktotalea sp. TaxID=2029877 RepID=UPI0025E8FFB9|nr:hypothetical protein [Planktotalea sp.]
MLGIAVDESGLIKGEHRVGSSLNPVLARELVNNPETDDEAILQRGGKYTLFHTQDAHAKRLKVPHEVHSWRDPKPPERSRLEYCADLRNFQAALGAKAPMPDELFKNVHQLLEEDQVVLCGHLTDFLRAVYGFTSRRRRRKDLTGKSSGFSLYKFQSSTRKHMKRISLTLSHGARPCHVQQWNCRSISCCSKSITTRPLATHSTDSISNFTCLRSAVGV